MRKSEKTFLFFALFSITYAITQHINLDILEIELADLLLMLICLAITMYGSLAIAIYDVLEIITEKIKEKRKNQK